ncbi:hypothetical protein SAMN04487972_102201 [Paracoccus halophilus]|uniref:Polysaccharide biosynthesis protein GumN n=1 Tax=Paracoccus halophilus TaxID=376733 RepID=A0A099F928_9RHOB|nr:TraB/GumN family protein [Paracoccus halophilus]KGJ06746.1 polysaccharide biosynthesis protein GumN [Paracoccus halophilus]SFA41840.1 hypothetical protein SAMN04487972_102201 [Paracoccus halophilus]
MKRHIFRPALTAFFLSLTFALPLAAQECAGRNLFQDMAPGRLAELRAASAAVPYDDGLFWQAEKDGMRAILIGTYHFGDPRHAITMERFAPEIARAGFLMVEAGPEEEARLTEAMASDPSLIVDMSGPTLPERLDKAEWQALSDLLEQRGLPAMVASRLRPWYVAVMLGISPCMIRMTQERGDSGGLDGLLTESALAEGVPIRALEPWNTLFTLFEGMTPEEEEDMIRAAMPAARYADDYAVTLADAYFAGESWMMWEFGRFDAYEKSGLPRDQIDAQMQMAQEKLMDQRNASWIGPIETTAAEAAVRGKAIVVGFGALHLPGEKGVLRRLENSGWRISPIIVEGIGNGG